MKNSLDNRAYNASVEKKDIVKIPNKKVEDTQKKIFQIRNKQEKLQTETKNKADKEVDYKLAQQTAFSFFDKNLTLSSLNNCLIKNSYISLDENVNSEELYKFLVDYFKENPFKSDLLNFIVENWFYSFLWVCPNSDILKSLKDIYKKNKLNLISSILSKYKTVDGKTVSVDDIIGNTGDCKPWVLYDKLLSLVDENWNYISNDQVKKIFSKITSLKKFSLEDRLVNSFFKWDKKLFEKYIKLVKEKWWFLDLAFSSQKSLNFISAILNELGLPKLDNNKLNTLAKNTESYIRASDPFESLSQKLRLIKEIKDKKFEITSFGKSAKTPEEFLKCWIPMYNNLVKTHKSLYAFGVSQFKKIFWENNKLLAWIIDKIPDFSEKDTLVWLKRVEKLVYSLKNTLESLKGHSSYEGIKYFLYNNFGWEALLKKVNNFYSKYKSKINNYTEEEYFMKKWYLFNTETVWLYNSNPNELVRYWGLKAPGTLWKNQITTRENFISVVKRSNISDLNSKWLVDYFYKAYVKYGDWNIAIWMISREIWIKKLKEILKYAKSLNDKWTRQAFAKFLKKNKTVISIIEKFNNLEWTGESVKIDIEILKDVLNSYKQNNSVKNPLLEIVFRYFEDIKNLKLLGESVKKSTNVINYVLNNSSNDKITTSIASSLIVNSLRKKTKWGKEVLEKIENKEVGNKLSSLRKLFDKYNLEIDNLPQNVLEEFKKKIIKAPDEAVQGLVKYLLTQNPAAFKWEQLRKFMIDLLKMASKNMNIAYKTLENIFNLLKSWNISQKEKEAKLKALLWKVSPDSKNYLTMFLKVWQWAQKNKEVKTAISHFVDLIEKWDISDKGISDIVSEFSSILFFLRWLGPLNNVIKNYDEINKTLENNIEKTKNIYENIESGNFSNDKKINKAKVELSKIEGFYTKEEKRELYQKLYFSTYVSDDIKQEIKNLAKKENIVLDKNNLENTTTKPVYAKKQPELIKDISNLNNEEKIILEYSTDNGLVTINNPFSDNLSDEKIKGLTIEEVNKKLLLTYLTKLWFYKVEDIFLWKDLKEIENIFSLDLSKWFDLDTIKKFSLNFISGLLYKLSNLSNISSIHKKYIKHFEKKFVSDPYNFETYSDFISFLNDNVNLLIKTWYYDFTEHSLKLNEFLNKEKDENYRKWLQEKDLFEKLS